MDDGGKPPHSCGNGQQRTQHPRPFFYVQPPSQPYYLYQHWQLNNPYNHYGLPGGFNIGRPFMAPYQYMPYPGFVFPHTPLYPMDYRRMFEPRFYTPTWNDGPRPQHHPQSQGRRETASSEVQTDPSDAITKLIECLDKIRATELQGAERELDSGVASHSSGMFSPSEEKKGEEQSDANILPTALDATRLVSPAVVFSDSTTAVYDGESSHRSLDILSPQVCWSGRLEEELPLDSSSIHEDGSDPEQPAPLDPFLTHEKSEVTNIQSDIPVAGHRAPKCDGDDLVKRMDPSGPPSQSLTPSSQPALKEAKSKVAQSMNEDDPGHQILKLPLESVFTSGAGTHLSSPATTAPYYYHHLSMQTTHERMSVLSPSLDELSSRDEMFSTDLEDVELFPRQAYSGRRLAEGIGSDQAPEEVAENVWLPGSKRFMCACCGKSLAKGGSRGKGHKAYRDEAADSEEDGRYGRGCEQPVRVVLRKQSAARKPHSGPLRHPAKPWYKRGQYKDPAEPLEPDEGHDPCKVDLVDGKPGETTGESLCRDGHSLSEQCKWADGGGIPRRRQAAPVQRQESSAQRKVMHQRPRDEDEDDDQDDKELPSSHWDRALAVPRC
ncbi:bucky ball-like isoform X2 [Dunckerocampus dactyliophorus]|uniref:bucky ball-like isoform X2 n=1 Tax=Dunckerocampus dactyliophorus TaxID=161453 RepID=UPI002406BACC|nr:bucky ball-like isoform X2 [Dunckerocampus dactyliophorus]